MSERDPKTAIMHGLDTDKLRSVLKQVDKVGWQMSHHLPVDLLALSLDEACHLSALLNRVLSGAKA